MTTLGKLWTDSVAYVALLSGAGLSIAANVADTFHIRGADTDTLDIVIAVAYPALVVLMVEVFVSARWAGLAWPMQCLRWLGTLAITAVAMRVSWVHGHQLMASRGQTEDVATLGPLAIDFLAIMATALILAGRGHGHAVAMKPRVHADTLATDTKTDTVMADTAARTRFTWPAEPDMATKVRLGCSCKTADTDTLATLPDIAAWQAGAARAEREIADEIADEAEEYLSDVQSSASRRRVPQDAWELINAWNPAELAKEDMYTLLAAHFGRSDRTIRRWKAAVTGSPTSGGR